MRTDHLQSAELIGGELTSVEQIGDELISMPAMFRCARQFRERYFLASIGKI